MSTKDMEEKLYVSDDIVFANAKGARGATTDGWYAMVPGKYIRNIRFLKEHGINIVKRFYGFMLYGPKEEAKLVSIIYAAITS